MIDFGLILSNTQELTQSINFNRQSMDKLIFIIDDDQVYLNFMKGHFRQMKDYTVEVHSNGDEAIKSLEAKNPFMIILDHNLSDPTKDGLYYLKKIKKIKPSVPTIYITSDSSAALKKEAAKQGAETLIVKSDSFLVQLRTAIDEISAPKKKGILSKFFK
jgi:DNA-binding NtrC family response regulator